MPLSLDTQDQFKGNHFHENHIHIYCISRSNIRCNEMSCIECLLLTNQSTVKTPRKTKGINILSIELQEKKGPKKYYIFGNCILYSLFVVFCLFLP